MFRRIRQLVLTVACTAGLVVFAAQASYARLVEPLGGAASSASTTPRTVEVVAVDHGSPWGVALATVALLIAVAALALAARTTRRTAGMRGA